MWYIINNTIYLCYLKCKELITMKFTIVVRKINLKDKGLDEKVVKEYVEKKLSKLDKFFREESDARVVLGTIKDEEYIEASIFASGMIYRAEESDNDILTAIDKIVDVIERQIRKNKTRLEKKIKRDSTASDLLISGANYTEGEDSNEFEIVKRKRFKVKPMSDDEAILQMNLLGHNFFVFKNVETDEANVVYRRKDGKYAIIESIDG